VSIGGLETTILDNLNFILHMHSVVANNLTIAQFRISIAAKWHLCILARKIIWLRYLILLLLISYTLWMNFLLVLLVIILIMICIYSLARIFNRLKVFVFILYRLLRHLILILQGQIKGMHVVWCAKFTGVCGICENSIAICIICLLHALHHQIRII